MDLKGYGEENCTNLIAHDSACEYVMQRESEKMSRSL